MSVLKAHRTESKAEFINVADKIYVESTDFLSRLSARYSRIFVPNVTALASEVISHAEKANSIFPSDDTRKQLRAKHLLEARGALMALDVQLSHCYDVLMTNPEGAFTNSNGKSLNKSEAEKKIERMAQTVGELIDQENALLTNVLKSDKRRQSDD